MFHLQNISAIRRVVEHFLKIPYLPLKIEIGCKGKQFSSVSQFTGTCLIVKVTISVSNMLSSKSFSKWLFLSNLCKGCCFSPEVSCLCLKSQSINSAVTIGNSELRICRLPGIHDKSDTDLKQVRVFKCVFSNHYGNRH